MKNLSFALLTICLFWGLVFPAYAAEIDSDMIVQEQTQEEQQPEDQQEPQDSPVVVSTLEELQAAVDTAEDGDSIYLDCTINMEDGDTLVTGKHITLRRFTGLMKTGGRMIELYGGGTISGFTFYEDCPISCSVIQTQAKGTGEIVIENCIFDVYKETNVSPYIMINAGDMAKISGCTFYCGNGYAIYTQARTNVLFDNCAFLKRHYYNWMMISTYGYTVIENSTFGAGTGYITASLDGEVTISNCEMAKNYFKSRIYPNVYLENKISGAGKINIVDEPIAGEGFYDLFTGEKVELPTEQDDLSALSYMTDEQAEQYFSSEDHIGQFDIKVDERNDHFDEPEEFPVQQPGDQTGDNTTSEELPPQDNPTEPPIEPVQPPEGEGKDDPAVTLPEAPEQPVEPPQDDTKDDPIDTPTTTPDTPQQPTDSGDSEDDDTPPVSHRPAHRPSTPVATPIKPTPTPEPEDKPKLSCGGATLDTSRTIVLLGYGDGDPHEEDPLTRAQLAAIIFRLLDDESIALYSNAVLAFTDVSADAWYAPYVQAINGAGIVYGVGGGRYDPEGIVNWAQIITILSRFVEPQEYALQHIQYDGWAQEAVQTAVALGWIEDSAGFKPDSIISRGELVQLVNRVLELNR